MMRVRRGEPDALDALEGRNFFEQLHKRRNPLRVRVVAAPVARHDLAEQRDFLHAAGGEGAALGHDVVHGTRTFVTARFGDDAECAIHVAALLDRNEGVDLAFDDTARIRLGREDITIRTALLEHRFICGHAPLAEELDTRLWGELFKNSGPEFIEAKLAESLHWVPIDPKTLQASAQMSGRAIEWLHKKQIEFCNEVRTTQLRSSICTGFCAAGVAAAVAERVGEYPNASFSLEIKGLDQ